MEHPASELLGSEEAEWAFEDEWETKKVEVDGSAEYRQQAATGVEPRVGADAPHQCFVIRHGRFEVVGRCVAHCRLAAREAEVVGLARRVRAREFLRRRVVRLPCPLRK